MQREKSVPMLARTCGTFMIFGLEELTRHSPGPGWGREISCSHVRRSWPQCSEAAGNVVDSFYLMGIGASETK